MPPANEQKPDLAAVQEDLAALKRDIANLIDHLKAGATGSARGAADHIDAAAQRIFRSAGEEAERSVKAMGRQVEEQPLTSLLIALGVGYIAGRLLAR